MSDKKKISEEELKSLQEAFSKLTQANATLGEVTTQAHLIQLEVLKYNETLKGVQRGLESKYGSISLDLETGEYTEEQAEGSEE